MLDDLSETLFHMFYAAPAPLHQLVRKCHDNDHPIDCGYVQYLKVRGLLTSDGVVPHVVKNKILAQVKLDRDSGDISMTLG